MIFTMSEQFASWAPGLYREASIHDVHGGPSEKVRGKSLGVYGSGLTQSVLDGFYKGCAVAWQQLYKVRAERYRAGSVFWRMKIFPGHWK